METENALIAGEALIDMFPTTEGPLDDVEMFERRAGGAPANLAVAMTRLGAAPYLWTRLGADPFGRHLKEALTDQGIPDRFLELDSTRKTAHTLVGDDPAADQSFVFYKEGTATMAMESGTVPDETLSNLEWVHFGGVMLCEEPARTAMLDLAERAGEAGCTVSFDPNTREDLWPDPADLEPTLRSALELADVVKTDREDLSILWKTEGASIESVAEELTTYGPHTVFLTQGGDETYGLATADPPWGAAETKQPTLDVDVVETTGAGDAFTAGVITALLEEKSFDAAIRFGNAVGALATTDTGAMAPLPTREAVEELL
ncbi:fructokinase protein [Halorhabdus tiamatea SARL4B]|uniref:Fructokinase n=1 Tax=Halorhabdus tiamatea SARL4B TaxID=1033806 RepID=F7PQK1_9EURY|nr:carbohydrate kinase [Halorhabdus tiamatea]ERJ05328.1 fructokinase protein [Halorhabdus tiamatea SARL4B]CCQ33186.1 fructokinase [Halorhabdus tiamatea SARL4B]